MTTTLPRHAADIASGVGETMTESIGKGRERARDMVVAAEEHLPEGAVEWTREHVPGLTPRRRVSLPPLVVVAAIIIGVATMAWLLRRTTNTDTDERSTQ